MKAGLTATVIAAALLAGGRGAAVTADSVDSEQCRKLLELRGFGLDPPTFRRALCRSRQVFLEAAASNESAQVELYLQMGMDPDTSDHDGATALMKSVSAWSCEGMAETVDVLLRWHASPMKADSTGSSAIHYAAGRSCYAEAYFSDLPKELAAKMAARLPDSWFTADRVLQAAVSGSTSQLEIIRHRDRELLRTIDQNNFTLLMHAAAACHAAGVMYLMQEEGPYHNIVVGWDIVRKRNTLGQTALDVTPTDCHDVRAFFEREVLSWE